MLTGRVEMPRKIRSAVGVGAVLATCIVMGTVELAGAQTSPPAVSQVVGMIAAKPALSRGVMLVGSSREVNEGDRYRLTATIKSPARAGNLTLQKLDVPLYYGEPSWEDVKTVGVRGRRQITFKAIATALNVERYRAVVSYKEAKTVKSRPSSTKVWRWTPLREYTPYYETSGLLFSNFTINGFRYSGWGPYTRAAAWEARFTPGRHCKALRGILGLSDSSADGSSGVVSVTADDVPVFQSSSLAPGMDEPVMVPLPLPYRTGLQLVNTSPEGLNAWPAVGDPALLCSGV
ncbi:hypothetical protein G6553_18080 [Nocardioides sp. IC4_145]|uniref:hypothetical protein n=1 Tax=Nocardioides sp. IC4_145 TaxID=2714037 RepID=UPI0014091609|nr:hypothetical protein [Nocardioides sp. IC4_145]NHC25079.1 hypothetical protein [Nocardioides sp. IC4_145]